MNGSEIVKSKAGGSDVGDMEKAGKPEVNQLGPYLHT